MLVNPTREELESNCSERGASCWCRVRTRESTFCWSYIAPSRSQTRASGTRRSIWWDDKSAGTPAAPS